MRVHSRGFNAGDAKKAGVKGVNVGQKTAPTRVHLAGGRGGAVERVCIPAINRHFANCVVTVQEILPESGRGGRPRKATTQTNHGDWRPVAPL